MLSLPHRATARTQPMLLSQRGVSRICLLSSFSARTIGSETPLHAINEQSYFLFVLLSPDCFFPLFLHFHRVTQGET